MADRFYWTGSAEGGRATLLGDEARHLARVRRIGVGQEVELFDGRGSAVRAEVVAVGRDRVELSLRDAPVPDRAAPCRLTLATAVPKGERFDWLVEKATELGVARLVPILAGRSTVDPRAAKLDRLRRVVVEASKQCGRNRLMDVAEPVPWPDYLGTESAPTRLIAHPGGLAPGCWPAIDAGTEAALAVGPEGGFTPEEVAAARAAGWVAVGLGATLLRIETAGLAGAALVFSRVGGEEP